MVEMRRKHPRWGAKRIRMQLLKAGGETVVPAGAHDQTGSCRGPDCVMGFVHLAHAALADYLDEPVASERDLI